MGATKLKSNIIHACRKVLPFEVEDFDLLSKEIHNLDDELFCEL